MSKPVLSDPFNFASGRRNRKSYILFFVALLVGLFVVAIIRAILLPISLEAALAVQYVGLTLLYVAVLAASSQRLRDVGWSGWWVVTFLIPLIGMIGPLVLFFVPGTAGDNRFGPSPVKAR